MGIIIILFSIPSMILIILSLIRIFVYALDKQIGLKEIILGLLTSIILFGIHILSYKIVKADSSFDSIFRAQIIMIIVPFVIHTFTERSKNKKLTYSSLILLISIGTTVILGVIFSSL
ncbi:MAG: hypothetical protein WA916_01140 [Arcobacter sp.]|uniref:hypothetical protein n=1 Tax=Arcobacter sp. TaxID=1872629 RepID=UPI003C7897A5